MRSLSRPKIRTRLGRRLDCIPCIYYVCIQTRQEGGVARFQQGERIESALGVSTNVRSPEQQLVHSRTRRLRVSF